MVIKRIIVSVTMVYLLFGMHTKVLAGETPGKHTDKLTRQERRQVIQKIAVMLKENYVFPDMADKLAIHLNKLPKKKTFKSITNREEFARKLEQELQAVSKDKHLRVKTGQPHHPVPVTDPGTKKKDPVGSDPLADLRKRMLKDKRDNYTFKTVKIMEGNVGYLDFRRFWRPRDAGNTLAAAMAFLANADAIIIDMRGNKGGFPPTVQLACSYFFDERILLNTLYRRKGNSTLKYWVLDQVDGEKMPDVPVYILTSHHTFSGAEGFCYIMSTHKRATLVGEVTGGGANFGRVFTITDKFNMFIPLGRPISPITGTNWEGSGIKPDVEATEHNALDKAYALAKTAAAEFRRKKDEDLAKKLERFNKNLKRIIGLFENNKLEPGKGQLDYFFQKGLEDGILDQGMINRLGYYFLEKKNNALALELLDFNTRAFPSSPNTWDNLAEAYLTMGDKEKAIRYYLKSITVSPGNSNGWQALKKLSGKSVKGLYLEMARQAARWLESVAVEQSGGLAWPADPDRVYYPNSTLYSHSPGVILFFLEAYHITGDPHYLYISRRGADFLLTTIPEKAEKNTGYGLYTGLSGSAFVLEETFRASAQEKYRQGVEKCIKLIQANAKSIGSGIEWDGSTDIIEGSAGLGLTLIYLSQRLNQPDLLTLAQQAGKRLLDIAIPEKGGLKWKLHPEYERIMPNFSHGTSGIAYFLATLYKHTKKKEFLEGALAGARYLLAIANTENDSCLVYHNDKGGEKLYYLGWCHGPTGTARLFYRLYETTGDNSWMQWLKKSANGILTSGIPGKLTGGFWNSVGRCCGSVGVAEFMLDIHRSAAEKSNNKTSRYLSFAKKMTEDLLKRATPAANGKGLKWIQAEHRVRPKLLQAQTGLMQGAAGIGLWLLKMHAHENGKKETIRFPDTPF